MNPDHITEWLLALSLTLVAVAVAVAVVRRFRRPGQDIDQAVALMCDPCHGKPGRCTCTSRCGHLDCIGDHTSFSRIEVRELEEMLAREDRRG